ncbi:MAG: citrate lyase beta subunit [halophilic archaeon J07HX64]|nr:MAG: citrate lyase beta subunit [halophilic archaeon J07HX64]
MLFSPGDRPDLLEKAPETGADVVVFDLEDGVAPDRKDQARETVADAVTDTETDELCVRVNPLGAGGRADLEALEQPPDSVMLPKVDGPGDVRALDDALAEHGLDLPVFALLETPGGVLDAPAVAAVDATDAVLLGAEDLSAAAGISRSTEGTEILYARERVVLAAARAGIDAIDTLCTDFEDTEGLAEDARLARQLGFAGKMTIHPAQVPVVNSAFTPDSDQVDWAERVLAARDEAQAEGRGVFTVDGEMIDAPLVTQAETILERARAAGTVRPDG